MARRLYHSLGPFRRHAPCVCGKLQAAKFNSGRQICRNSKCKPQGLARNGRKIYRKPRSGIMPFVCPGLFRRISLRTPSRKPHSGTTRFLRCTHIPANRQRRNLPHSGLEGIDRLERKDAACGSSQNRESSLFFPGLCHHEWLLPSRRSSHPLDQYADATDKILRSPTHFRPLTACSSAKHVSNARFSRPLFCLKSAFPEVRNLR